MTRSTASHSMSIRIRRLVLETPADARRIGDAVALAVGKVLDSRHGNAAARSDLARALAHSMAAHSELSRLGFATKERSGGGR